MDKKLKKRFIITSTLVTFIIISVIVFFINISNYRAFLNTSSDYLKEFVLAADPAEFEEINSFIKKYDDIYIVNYESNVRGKIRHNHRRILNIVEGINRLSQVEGIYRNYRFYKDELTKKIYLVNIKRNHHYFYSTLANSLIVLIISVLGVLILSYFLSGYAIKPIIESRNKQKKFITDASHELKTPLAIIISNIELLEYDLEGNKYLKNIKLASNRLNLLVNDLLSLAKLDEQRKKSYTKFDLSNIARDISEYYGGILLQKGCTLITSIESHLFIKANEDELIKVINILLENTLKYSSDDTEVLFNVYKNSKSIFIETINNAKNLEKRDYNEIFDRFTQLDMSRNNGNRGSGIGLSILSTIIENHNGKVKAVSDGNRLKIIISIPA